jgi:hypothetical protein
LLLGNGSRTQRCKAIGIDKEEAEEIANRNINKMSYLLGNTYRLWTKGRNE